MRIIRKTIIDQKIEVPPLAVKRIPFHGEASNETCAISYSIEVNGDIHWMLMDSGGNLICDSNGYPPPYFWLGNKTYFIYLDNMDNPRQQKSVEVKVMVRYEIEEHLISIATLTKLYRILSLLRIPMCIVGVMLMIEGLGDS